MKYTLAFALFFGLSLLGFAQEPELNSPLPDDPDIRKGVLPNGLTYYIAHTDVTKGVASYYIIQNVGSILENEDQLGLAHFLEHMAFNGTRNFEGKGILDTMQQHGLLFGRDINAYTSFDETVYNLNNVPTTPELIDTALLVLYDWCNGLLLTDGEIDAERGVITEEWRTRQNGGMRILVKSLPSVFNNTNYARRMPIGSMEVIQNFQYDALRDFYHDWYRTDLQAIAIVGDLDVDATEAKIKRLFSQIEPVENPKERFVVEIPPYKEMRFTLALDDEVTTSNISLGIVHPSEPKDKTVADLKKDLLDHMAINMLSKRIGELSRKPGSPFLGAHINYGSHSRTTKSFNVSISPKPDLQHEAFKAVLSEVVRAVKHGFVQTEIDRTIEEVTSSYENQIRKKDDRPHGQIVHQIQNNYLNHAPLTEIGQEYDLIKPILDGLGPEELHTAIKELYDSSNRFLLVTGVKGRHNLTEAAALELIDAVEHDKALLPYVDEFSGKTLVSGIEIDPGRIVSEAEDALGATTFILSNGVVVHYKFADKNKNDLRLNAISYGGRSLVSDSDLPSAHMLGRMTDASGLGSYSPTELSKVLAGKTASTAIHLDGLTERITGRSVSKDVETLLQMVHLRFVAPRFDPDGYKLVIERAKNQRISRSENLAEKMSDSTTVAVYGKDHPRKRLFDQRYIEDISFDRMKALYGDRFGNAADFEFFIVGDVEADVLKPLVETYIASIPTSPAREQWKDNSDPWARDVIGKEIFMDMKDPKGSVRIAYRNDFAYSLRDALLARTLGDILALRYIETLREEEGGTYGARAWAHLSKRPVEEATLYVNFDCNPDQLGTLTAIVHREIEKLAQGDIQQLDLDKTLTSYLKERKQYRDYNDYDMELLTTFHREGYNMDDPRNFVDLIGSITKEDVQRFTQKLLKGAQTYSIVFKPMVRS